MTLHDKLQHAIRFCRKINRGPVIFIGDDAFSDYVDSHDMHAYSLSYCLHAPKREDLLDINVNLYGMGVHLESYLSPFDLDPIAQHLFDCGAEAVFCTNLKTKKTVVFTREARHAA